MKQIALLGAAALLPRVTAALAQWACRQGEVILVDADAEASGLAHMLPGEVLEEGLAAVTAEMDIDPELCTGCGNCQQACHFDAVTIESGEGAEARTDAHARILRWACCGCGACVSACADGAIRLIPAPLGRWHRQRTPLGRLYSASLEPGREHLGEVVTIVRQRATREAVERYVDWMLIAGPVGSGRAAIAACVGVDLLLAVVEPGPLGKRPLEHALALADRVGASMAFIVAHATGAEADLDEGELADALGIDPDAILGQVSLEPACHPTPERGEAPSPAQDPLVEALAPIWEACRARLQDAPEADAFEVDAPGAWEG
jgi:MinD superfamily P-loop ATPase